ncbi:hypothetical protein CVU37_15085 [candidate division BRC1 bacterium HGW-BRC1-1]|jgi:phage gp36-like protein|nr:MAG: hypothetical protein CVU37_15085 [candidate division BRC1 bacterium HGW-BRC1-1]
MGRYVEVAGLVVYAPEGRVLELLDAPFGVGLATLGVAELAVAEAAIASAEDEIDGVLGRRVAVPLASPSGEIKRMAAQGALFHLSARKSEFVEVWAKQRDGNLKRLESVALAEQEAVGASVVEGVMSTVDGDGICANGGLGKF